MNAESAHRQASAVIRVSIHRFERSGRSIRPYSCTYRWGLTRKRRLDGILFLLGLLAVPVESFLQSLRKIMHRLELQLLFGPLNTGQ